MSKTGINHFINSPEISRLINQNDWTAVYKEIGRLTVLTFIPVEFTDLIYEADIDPLTYMEEVPPYYLSGDFGIRSPLKYINIPNNIKFIGNCAFSRSSLKEVKIPGDVGNAAFRSSDLEKVEVFEGVSFIRGAAFNACKLLTSVSLPSSLKYLGKRAFTDCPQLHNIDYSGNMEQWKKLATRTGDFKPSLVIKCADGELYRFGNYWKEVVD